MFYVNLICWQNAKISEFKISVINSIWANNSYVNLKQDGSYKSGILQIFQ